MTSRLLAPRRRPRAVTSPPYQAAGGTAAREDLGWFDSRDDLFRAYGQTLCPAARRLVDPVLSRHAYRGQAITT